MEIYHAQLSGLLALLEKKEQARLVEMTGVHQKMEEIQSDKMPNLEKRDAQRKEFVEESLKRMSEKLEDKFKILRRK